MNTIVLSPKELQRVNSYVGQFVDLEKGRIRELVIRNGEDAKLLAEILLRILEIENRLQKGLEEMAKAEKEKGMCVNCHRLTAERHRFTDDPESNGYGYLDWCCDECYEHLVEKI